MTVVDFLNKRHKVTKYAIDVLTELYGQPAWLVNPKDGQNSDVILREWIEELGEYSATDLKRACLAMFRYKKCSTFPSLSHVSSMLMDREKELGKTSPAPVHQTVCIESELFERDCKLGRPFYMMSHYRRAVKHILDFTLPEAIGGQVYRELELSSRDEAVVRGKKYQRALELGLFNELDHLLWQSKNGGLEQ